MSGSKLEMKLNINNLIFPTREFSEKEENSYGFLTSRSTKTGTLNTAVEFSTKSSKK
jgi:hypothetical protein